MGGAILWVAWLLSMMEVGYEDTHRRTVRNKAARNKDFGRENSGRD